ncbi:hypothetical protein [Clostridium paraputrificum]|uniref:hypothetical protein n=1 Tax=Clostridium paraputrificum TaxID=29363 RepID=UPI000C08B505|nr:hypothetical protein [Clostridium paraputrificum]
MNKYNAKINLTLIPIVIILSVIIAVIFPQLSLMKDLIIIVSIIYCFIIDRTFESKSFVYIFLYALAMIIFTVITGKINMMAIINIRFIFIYPLMIHVGRVLGKKNVNFDVVYKILNYYYAFLVVGAVLEFIAPEILRDIAILINPEYQSEQLIRSGLGIGLGTWYGSRQMLAMDMCMAIVVLNKTCKNEYLKLIISLVYVFVIAMTLNRTGMISAIFLILLIFIYRKKKYYKISKGKILLIYALICVLILFTTLVENNFIIITIEKMVNSLGKIDLTMSGRTDIIKNYLQSESLIFPKIDAIGRSDYAIANDTYGIGTTADNSILRLVISYGILFIIPYIIVCLRVIYGALKSKDLFYIQILSLYFVAGIAFDLFHMVTVIIPIWMIIGYTLENERERRKT